jgi:hypothetical protein
LVCSREDFVLVAVITTGIREAESSCAVVEKEIRIKQKATQNLVGFMVANISFQESIYGLKGLTFCYD